MDCNNFFVSCERLFRPDLLGKPVAVLSSNDGCVVARSQEVKDLGVQMGVPYFEIKDMCMKQKVTFFSSNFALYRDISSRVMSAMKSEFDTYEIYSIDEAFFEIGKDVTEEEMAQIRARIIQKTGIPVSIGVATTKTLAKVANSIAKKRHGRLTMSAIQGVCIMDEGLWENTQKDLMCGSIWGIGRQTSASLSRHKIYTVSDLLKQDKAFIKQLLGIVGERIIMELSGTSVYAIGAVIDEEQQSYTSTRSFSSPIRDKSTILSALGYHVAHLAEKLRNDKCTTSKIGIVARGSRFGEFTLRTGSTHSVLSVPTNDTFTLTKEVIRLFDSIYDSEIPYKKAGVIVSGIESIDNRTESLFSSSVTNNKTDKLNIVTDTLNERFGAGTVRTGITLKTEKWKSSKKLVSKEYTTNWNEIASVKAE